MYKSRQLVFAQPTRERNKRVIDEVKDLQEGAIRTSEISEVLSIAEMKVNYEVEVA